MRRMSGIVMPLPKKAACTDDCQRVAVIDYGHGQPGIRLPRLWNTQARCALKSPSDPPLSSAGRPGVLPGVGAIRDCCPGRAAAKLGFWRPVVRDLVKEKPLLGIASACRLLFESSEKENGGVPD